MERGGQNEKMINKKGQVEGIGMFVTVAILVILGTIILTASASNVGQVTQLTNFVNRTLGECTNQTSTTFYLTDLRDITDVIIWNETTSLVAAANYTLTSNLVHNGGLAVSILPINTSGINYTWFISGTGQPTTYETNSGGRAIAGIIILFAALAVAVVALTPALQSKILDYV